MDELDQFRMLDMKCSSIVMGDEIADEDVIDRIEPLIQSITDKIKLLTKQLADTTVKKLALLKQFDEITNLEDQLQKELREEMSKKKKVPTGMNERQTTLDMDNELTTLENDDFVKRLLGLVCSEADLYAVNTGMDNNTSLSVASVTTKSIEMGVPPVHPIGDVLLSPRKTLKMEVNDENEADDLSEALDEQESQDATEGPDVPEESVQSDADEEMPGKRRYYRKGLKCPNCGKICMRKDYLQRHIERGCKDLTHVCTECNRQFTCSSSLKLHARTHSEPSAVQLESKDNESSIASDKPEKDAEDLKCPKCSKTYLRRDYLDRHIRRQCQEKTYPCVACERIFINSSDLKYHVNRYHSSLPPSRFQCPRCPKSLSTTHWLKRHLRWHDNEFTHLCPTCGKGYVDAVALKWHIVGKHNKPQFKCDICEHYYLSERYLKKHMSVHSGEFVGVCATCGKAFATESLLQHHMLVHSKKAFHCTLCKRDFTTNSRLKEHMRAHSGEKTFICKVCQNKYINKFQLEKHRRESHNRPVNARHVCAECGKECFNVANLKTHLRTHSAEKPSECDLCSNRYKSKYDMLRHRKKIHGVSLASLDESAVDQSIKVELL